MLRNISQIVYQLFQKETLDEVSESELRYFIRQYPYAGTGHLLLAKKLQLEGEKRAFEREIAITSIYFNNPAWLQFVLQEHNGNGNGNAEILRSPFTEQEFTSVKDTEVIEQVHETGDYNVHEQPEISDDIPGDIEDEVDEAEINEAGFNDTESDQALKQGEVEALEPEPEEPEPQPVEPEPEEPEPQPEEPEEEELEEEPEVKELKEEEEEERDSRLETAEEEKVVTQSTNNLIYDDGEVFAEFIAEETNEELRLNEETLNAPWETEEEEDGENSSEEEGPVSDEELRKNFEKRKHLTSEVVAGDRERPESLNRDTEQENIEQPGHHVEYSDDQMVDRPDLISFEGQKASQRDPLPEEHNNADVQNTNTDSQKLDFDPYYTIDYFASQGIKLKLEDLTKDKLGQQLKSFTEWIRSMKRLPQQVAENSMDETAQHSIRRIAEHSVEEKEVLTESMAEVWIKQGNYEKARQIYRKLSLQNPSKSTYFAAKIDQLKVL